MKTCLDCGKPISKGSAGRCEDCAPKHRGDESARVGIERQCNICHHLFKPHKYQHPKYTYFCDDCRNEEVRERWSTLRWIERRA